MTSKTPQDSDAKSCADALSLVNEAKLYSKITWRLIPFLFVCYVFAYIDRVNIGFAKFQMQESLKLTEADYGFAAGIFFLGYVLFEVPSNLLFPKIGARKTFSRILILWGLTSASMVFVTSAPTFYILRFMLGVFEAGFAPGMLFYLTYWYSSSRMAAMTSTLILAAPIASILGGPISGEIIAHFHDKSGLMGWQWMFLLEAVPAVLLGFLALRLLPNSPSEAHWLTETERRFVAQQTDVSGKSHSFGMALRDLRTYALALVCFCITCGIYAVGFWLPTILKGNGGTSIVAVGWLSAIPYVCAAISMVVFGRLSDKLGDRRFLCAGLMLGGTAAMGVAAYTFNRIGVGLIAISIATALLWAALSIFWAIPSSYLGGSGAAGGIAFINSVGLLGGFVSPWFIGIVKNATGSVQNGLFALVLVIFIGALTLLLSNGIGQVSGKLPVR